MNFSSENSMGCTVGSLNSINDEYQSTGVSGVNADVLLHGRPYGGVAILWKKALASKVSAINCEYDHHSVCSDLKLSTNECVLVFNCNMPTDS